MKTTFSWFSSFFFWLVLSLSYFSQNEMECAYYMRNGQCKFGSTCKFHHPQPSNMMVSLRGSAVYPPIHSPTTSQLSFPLSRASFIASPRWQSPSSYAPLVMQQGVVSVPGWNTYSVIFSEELSFIMLIVSSRLYWVHTYGQTSHVTPLTP